MVEPICPTGMRGPGRANNAMFVFCAEDISIRFEPEKQEDKIRGDRMKNKSSDGDHLKLQDRVIHKSRAGRPILKHIQNLFPRGSSNSDALLAGPRLYDEEMRERYRM